LDILEDNVPDILPEIHLAIVGANEEVFMISPIDSFVQTIFLRIYQNYPVKASPFFLRRARTIVALIRRAFMTPSIVRATTSARGKDSVYFTQNTYFFYFT